jgi:hypothetical protein
MNNRTAIVLEKFFSEMAGEIPAPEYAGFFGHYSGLKPPFDLEIFLFYG